MALTPFRQGHCNKENTQFKLTKSNLQQQKNRGQIGKIVEISIGPPGGPCGSILMGDSPFFLF